MTKRLKEIEKRLNDLMPGKRVVANDGELKANGVPVVKNTSKADVKPTGMGARVEVDRKIEWQEGEQEFAEHAADDIRYLLGLVKK